MKTKTLFIIIVAFLAIPTAGQVNLAQKLSGRILLQVESKGEAWYINPSNLKKYFLGRPQDAYYIMRQLGIGITNDNLAKIPMENEAWTGENFVKRNAGKIFLQVENLGQAWYVNPVNLKRYFLGRPDDAWQIMRRLSLGIANDNLAQIIVGQLSQATTTANNLPPIQESVIEQAARAIRAKNKSLASSFFISAMKGLVEYAVENMSSESLLILGNILSGSKLTSSTDSEKIYSGRAYFSFGGYEVPLKFHIKKQPDGQWLIANL